MGKSGMNWMNADRLVIKTTILCILFLHINIILSFLHDTIQLLHCFTVPSVYIFTLGICSKFWGNDIGNHANIDEKEANNKGKREKMKLVFSFHDCNCIVVLYFFYLQNRLFLRKESSFIYFSKKGTTKSCSRKWDAEWRTFFVYSTILLMNS